MIRVMTEGVREVEFLCGRIARVSGFRHRLQLKVELVEILGLRDPYIRIHKLAVKVRRRLRSYALNMYHFEQFSGHEFTIESSASSANGVLIGCVSNQLCNKFSHMRL